MHTRRFIQIFCAVLLLCTSCAQGKRADFSSGEEAEFAQNWLEKLRLRDYAYVYEHSGEKLKSELSEQAFEAFVSTYFDRNVKNISLLHRGYKTFKSLKSGGFSRYDFVYEYEFENNQYAAAQIALERNESGLSVIGVTVTETGDSQKNINKFTLKNKTFKHYAVLFFALLMPLYSLCMFVVCLCTRFKRKHKIPWLLFILLGFGAVDINWTTGALRTGIGIQLLSAAAYADRGVWHVMFSVPLGAILFWVKRKKITAAAKNNNEVT